MLHFEHPPQYGQDRTDIRTFERRIRRAEQFLRRPVRQQDTPRIVHCQNGQRAGFNQNAHLLLGRLAQPDLCLQLLQMGEYETPFSVELGEEKSRQGEAGKCDYNTKWSARTPSYRAEFLPQDRTDGGGRSDL